MSAGPDAAAGSRGRGLRLVLQAAVFAGGCACGVFVHYALHRFLLTIEPFIYISF